MVALVSSCGKKASSVNRSKMEDFPTLEFPIKRSFKVEVTSLGIGRVNKWMGVEGRYKGRGRVKKGGKGKSVHRADGEKETIGGRSR